MFYPYFPNFITETPCRYTSCYEALALKGLRVLSLGYRRVVDAPADGEFAREWVEAGLTFAGFIAFTCKTRADSRAVCSCGRSLFAFM